MINDTTKYGIIANNNSVKPFNYLQNKIGKRLTYFFAGTRMGVIQMKGD